MADREDGWPGIAGRALGLDMIVVTTTGRRTGSPRTVPLGAVRDGDRWLVGGREPVPYVARRPGGEEADRAWRLALGTYPGYADYQARTDRKIPLFLLEPA